MKIYYIGSEVKEIRSGGDKYLSEMLQGLAQNCDLEFWDISVCDFGTVSFRLTWRIIFYVIKTNIWALKKFKKVNRSDVILINSYYKQQFVLVPWIAKYFKGCKIILSVNAFYDHSRSSVFLNILDRVIMKLFLLPAGRVIANSKATKEKIERIGISPKKIKIVYPRLDLPPDLPDFFPQNNGLFHIIYVGYCTPFKEVDILIRAMGILKTTPMFLHIVGETDRYPLYFNRLLDLTKHLGLEGKVVFHGRLEGTELSVRYKNADIFVNACRGEGYGRVFIEAMHFGLPVIGANQGGAKELIADGINGFLFQPGDAKDLANKMLILYKDANLCRKMGEEGVKKSRLANFSENLGEQVLRIIEELI